MRGAAFGVLGDGCEHKTTPLFYPPMHFGRRLDTLWRSLTHETIARCCCVGGGGNICRHQQITKRKMWEKRFRKTLKRTHVKDFIIIFVGNLQRTSREWCWLNNTQTEESLTRFIFKPSCVHCFIRLSGLIGWAHATETGELGSIPGRVIPQNVQVCGRRSVTGARKQLTLGAAIDSPPVQHSLRK